MSDRLLSSAIMETPSDKHDEYQARFYAYLAKYNIWDVDNNPAMISAAETLINDLLAKSSDLEYLQWLISKFNNEPHLYEGWQGHVSIQDVKDVNILMWIHSMLDSLGFHYFLRDIMLNAMKKENLEIIQALYVLDPKLTHGEYHDEIIASGSMRIVRWLMSHPELGKFTIDDVHVAFLYGHHQIAIVVAETLPTRDVYQLYWDSFNRNDYPADFRDWAKAKVLKDPECAMTQNPDVWFRNFW
jgi:hypothetical protein